MEATKQQENEILWKALEMGTQSLSPQEFEKLESALHWIREARGLDKHKTESVPLDAVVILQRTDIENIAQMVCDPENQPHQYMGDIDGFTELIKEKIAKNCLADFNDAMINIIPEDFDGKKVNEIYNRLLSALSK